MCYRQAENLGSDYQFTIKSLWVAKRVDLNFLHTCKRGNEWHDSVVRQSYGGDYFSIQKCVKSTIVHHKLTQYCISVIIKQKKKPLNPCSLRFCYMVFLGSSGWGKNIFQIVLNGTERGTLVVWGLFQGKPLTSPEAQPGTESSPDPGRVLHRNPFPSGEHRHHCSQRHQPWCCTTDPVTRPALCCSDAWTTHGHLCHTCHVCPKHPVRFPSLCGTVS